MEIQELPVGEIIASIQDKLPALFFVFSRGRTELLAQELGRQYDFLNKKEKKEVAQQVAKAEEAYLGTFSGPSWRVHKQLLMQGIAYHHAGLLPPVKYLVEKLYSQRLLWVVFCTETFAAGVNFPAASAVFDSTRKWDGRDFRILQNREFFQMAGRAGRRGFDRQGHAFIRVDGRFPEQTGFFKEKDVEPVEGRLVISPNTVLSLLRYKSDEEINRFLNENFRMYQLKKKKHLLENEIKKIEETRDEIAKSLCPQSQTFSCPVQREKARRQLKRLSWRGKDTEKEALKFKLAQAEPKHCNGKKKCRAILKKLSKIEGALNTLKQEHQVISLKEEGIFTEFSDVRRILEELGYVKGREFFPRGIFALEVHVQEILVTEFAFAGILEDADPAEVAAVLAGVEFIPGKNVQAAKIDLPALREAAGIKRQLLKLGVPERFCIWSGMPGALAYAWYKGASFAELVQMTTMQPGDIFSLFRREIDLLRQIERAAAANPALAFRAAEMRKQIDRGEVALCF